MKRPSKGLVLVGTLVLAGVIAGVYSTPTATSQVVTLSSVRVSEQPDLDPNWRLWSKVPSVDVPTTTQNIAYPWGGGSVPAVSLKAVTYFDTLYVRVAWRDATRDDTAVATDSFTDATALEFPAASAVTVPSFCMGQANAIVNIWQWRAAQQTGDPNAVIAGLYPNGYADSYPDELTKNPVYQPARALKNPSAAFGETEVENLVAQAFGTLAPAADQIVTGKGVWQDGTWSVVFRRSFAAADPSQATFAAGTRTNMAVAVWDGSKGDRNGQKSVSQFVTLSLGNAALVEATAHDWGQIWLALVLGGGALMTGLAVLVIVGARSFGGRRP